MNPDEPDTVYILTKRNYKVYANVGETFKNTRRFNAILDKGTGSSFIRMNELPTHLVEKIRPLDDHAMIRNASGKPDPIAGTIDLTVQIGTSQTTVTFIVAKQLATSLILGCDFSDLHVDAIRPRRCQVKMDNRSIVPIVRQPRDCQSELSLLEDDDSSKQQKNRSSPKIKVTKSVVLKSDQQTRVEVVSKRDGLMLVDSYPNLFSKQMCLVASGIANVSADQPLRLLVANFGSTSIELRPRKAITKASDHPTNLVESHISHGELLDLFSEDTNDGKFRKRHIDHKIIDTINRHLDDQRESHMAEDETPTTADDIKLGFPEDKENAMRTMLRKHKTMWSGQLSEIKETELRIELNTHAKPFKSPQYRAGPKTRELEQSEINKQLKAGVIEPAISECSAPVLFAPKKDGRLRFCIEYRKLNP